MINYKEPHGADAELAGGQGVFTGRENNWLVSSADGSCTNV